jgi:hypothetical protein
VSAIRTRTFAAVAFIALFAATAQAQFINNGRPQQLPGRAQAVEYLYPEQVSVLAGKPTKVLLHFRVAPGLHINSHAPHDEFLISTVFSIPDGKGVRLQSAAYPVGVDIALPIDPKTKLNVYTGEFVIEARIVSEPGNHLIEAKLRFQACDQRECMPPKTIPVAIDVVGK